MVKDKTVIRSALQISELFRGIARSWIILRSDPKYSDFTIVCEGKEYAVRRCIICPRSSFFAKACDGGFEESVTNRVVLHEKPALVKGMIDYLYTLDYGVKLPPPEPTTPQQPDGEKARDNPEMPTNMPAKMSEDAGTACGILSFHIMMYSLADRMFIQGLKALSKEKVEKELAQRRSEDVPACDLRNIQLNIRK
ncbi:unnamed protein product [Penicillium viridicatum]